MRRRHLLAGLGALAAPSIVKAQSSRVLRFVPTPAVSYMDPVWTTANFGVATVVFESLYSVDENLQPRPQMAAGHTIEDGGKRWIIKLRDGLRFHDNEPVLARDCAASIGRWMKRDASGKTLAQRLDSLEAPDDRTVVFRLKKPFPQLPFVLGKAQPNVLPIVPSRLAATDPGTQMSETIGCGPFRFVANEFSIGHLAVFERFAAYRPRDEAPNGTSGGRIAKVDRVEWLAIPDAATASAALLTGEVDWLDFPIPDMVPRLQRQSGHGRALRPVRYLSGFTSQSCLRSDREFGHSPRHHGGPGREGNRLGRRGRRTEQRDRPDRRIPPRLAVRD